MQEEQKRQTQVVPELLRRISELEQEVQMSRSQLGEGSETGEQLSARTSVLGSPDSAQPKTAVDALLEARLSYLQDVTQSVSSMLDVFPLSRAAFISAVAALPCSGAE